MSIINLKKYYGLDLYADVPKYIIQALEDMHRKEHAARERDRYHGHIPLDWVVGYISYTSPLLDEHFLQAFANQQLYHALLTLPELQFRRLIAKYFFRLSITQIAKNEGVNKQSVSESIRRAKKI
jgi:RNA polymerase sigma-70 factor (ECF subfamily)